MARIAPCLTFIDQTEAAVNFYVSLFKNSKILHIMRSESGPVPKGKVLHAAFELDGRVYTAMDGGPSFSFTEAFSLVATCDTQEELDGIWNALSEGGEPGRCGWLTDRFGVSWQVIPSALGQMMSHPEKGNSQKVIEALLGMRKIDIDTLRSAYEQD